MGYAGAFGRARRGVAAVVGAAALAAVAGACGGAGGAGPSEEVLTRRGTLTSSGVQLRVDVTVVGDTATIRSVVTNPSAAPVAVTARMCGLDVQPALRWADAVRCAGYSSDGPLAPGDSLVETDRRIAPRSVSALRVRHLLSPELWVDVTLR